MSVEDEAVKHRRDGEETRARILDAALQVFGEKGFHDATHAEICERAGANIAAINYHFGSKDDLYRATLMHALDEVDAVYPVSGGVAAGASARERLRGNLHALLMRFTAKRLGHFHSIRLSERLNPTGLLDDLLRDRIGSYRQYTRNVLRDLLGQSATDADVELCELSVISQCHAVRVRASGRCLGPRWQFTGNDVDRLVDHIVRFSLAGIRAMKRTIKSRSEPEQAE